MEKYHPHNTLKDHVKIRTRIQHNTVEEELPENFIIDDLFSIESVSNNKLRIHFINKDYKLGQVKVRGNGVEITLIEKNYLV